MDYKKIYDSICKRAKLEIKDRKRKKKLGFEYYEGHHILPKCLGGCGWANNPNHPNIVLLTAREHFLCHWLLHEMHPKNYKLALAFDGMCTLKGKKQYRYIPSSRIVEYAKIISSSLHSEYMKNTFWTEDMREHMKIVHTGKTHSKETIELMKVRIKESITDEIRQKRSERIYGDNNPAKREEVQKKMKIAAKNRKRVFCPYCKKDGPINQMKQWHFDNCKNKE